MRYFHASKTLFDVGTELTPTQPGGAVFVFEGDGDPQQLFDGGFFIQAGCEFLYEVQPLGPLGPDPFAPVAAAWASRTCRAAIILSIVRRSHGLDIDRA